MTEPTKLETAEENIYAARDLLAGKGEERTAEDRMALADEMLVRALVALAASKVPREARRRLPDERESITRKVEIAGHDFYITVGLYPDDHQPGEIFIRSAKEGSTLAGLLDTIGILLSLALQYSVPLKAITDKLAFSSFEPAGFTNVKGIEYAKSPVDFLARWIAIRFLSRQVIWMMGSMPSFIARSPAAMDDMRTIAV